MRPQEFYGRVAACGKRQRQRTGVRAQVLSLMRGGVLAGLLLSGAVSAARAQSQAVSPTAANVPQGRPLLDGTARASIVDKVAAILKEYYVYPDMAAKIEAHLRERLHAGAYDAITRSDQFARTLTGDMIDVSKDRHLGIGYHPLGDVGNGEAEMTPEEHAKQNREMQRFGDTQNWGFVKAEILPGNVGYLDLRFFGHPAQAGDSLMNAMAFVSRTDALVLDLRANGGGYPQTVALLLSYLMERASVHGSTEAIPLFVQNDRVAGTETKIETVLFVPGKKYLDRDVYVLTSRRSFSGAELFADAVKTHKRAIVIGETTGGGSHSMLTRPVTPYLEMAVSFGWTKDAVTGFDWEGVGITPDVSVPAQTALAEAHLRALRKKAQTEKDPQEIESLARQVKDAEQTLAQAQPKGPLDGNTTFRLKGHLDAKAVFLVGAFNRFDAQAQPLVRDGKRGWMGRIDLAPGRYSYKFVVDGSWIFDPDNPLREVDTFGYENSIRTVIAPKK